MKRNDIITFALLLALTVATAIFSTHSRFAIFTLSLLVIKFLLVAFQYMELKKAHAFWQYAIVLLVLAISGIIVAVL